MQLQVIFIGSWLLLVQHFHKHRGETAETDLEQFVEQQNLELGADNEVILET